MIAGVTERAWSISVPHHARGAALARRSLAASLKEHRVDENLATEVTMVVSELVGNAARHARPLAGDVIRLSWSLGWSLGDAWVEVRVTDGGSPESPTLRPAPLDAINGRGLQIVAALATRWGVESTPENRTVWALLIAPNR